MSSKSWRYLAVLGAVALVLGACGSTSVVLSGTPTPKAPTATATKPAPTATPTTSVAVGMITACFGPDAASWHVSQVGDLLFAPVMLAGLTYPSVMLPDGTPLSQPYKMAHDNIPTAPGTGYTDFPTSPLTNPALANSGSKGSGFALNICNLSASARHSLQGISARIEGFTAYGGQLNQWNWCAGSVDSHHNPTASGCGGAAVTCVCFNASFPAGAGAGATATATQTDGSLNAPGDGLANFPFVLAPGKAITILVTVTAPTAPGRYVFNAGVTYDGGSSPVYAPTPAPEVLLAPVAHKWDGMTCMNTPSLLSQITATAPETYYICSK